MRSLIFFILSLLPLLLVSQIQPDEELSIKLEGKQKFSEIKQTVLNHYNSKINTLYVSDTINRKKYMRQLKMWNRQFWISEYYTNKEGIVQNAYDINQAGIEEMKRMQPSESNRHQPYNWNLQGPLWSDNGIGRFDKIAFHPTNANIIYAGSPHGGLFKTLDGGNNWVAIGDFIHSLGVSGITIDPISPNIIYILTGDGNSSDQSFVNNYLYRSDHKGVFKSIDGGNNWQKTGPLSINDNLTGRELIIHPTNPDILLAATTDGIYRTVNGGATWNLINNNSMVDIKFKPGDPTIVYAVGNHFFRSVDGGENFVVVLSGNTGGALANSVRTSIGVSQNDASKVYVLQAKMVGNTASTQIHNSTDSGLSFSTISNIPHILENQLAYNHTIAVNTTNANDIFVGGINVWRSTNGGVSWTQVSKYWPWESPYLHPDIHHLIFNPINNNLYCANDGGIYLFENNVWTTKYNGLSTSQFYHFEREDDNGKIWGGLQDNGIQVQVNAGTYYMDNTGDGYDQITDHPYNTQNGNSDDVYFTINDGIYRELNGVFNGISVPGNTSFFGNLAIDPFNENSIYVGYNQAIYKSFDKGSNWIALSNGTNTEFPGNWCISPSGSSIIAAGSSNGNWGNGLRKYNSINGIENFTPQLIQAGYDDDLKITDIDINQNNLNGIYISVAGTNANSKVFCSTNAGATWSNITFDLPNVPVFSIKLDLSNGIYVGTSIGVFYKPNNYTHWQPYSNALPPTPITEIELDNPNSNIYISTFGRGIWYTQKYTPVCDYDLPLSGELRGVHYMESTNTIISTQKLEGGEGTIVKYNTGNRITLSNGFRARYGSSFKTYLTGCGGPANN